MLFSRAERVEVLDMIYRIDRIKKNVEPVGACVPHARSKVRP